MTTGIEHKRLTEISVPIGGGDERRYVVPCHCEIGADHDDPQVLISEYNPNDDEEPDEEGEQIDVYQAASIWRSSGEDADSMFGYSEDELRQAADED